MKIENAEKILGYDWEDIKSMQQGTYKPKLIVRKIGTDYGHNGMAEDGLFTMTPSGDRVTFDEMKRRLDI